MPPATVDENVVDPVLHIVANPLKTPALGKGLTVKNAESDVTVPLSLVATTRYI